MSLRNLLKKRAELFKKIKLSEIDLKSLFMNNFRDIVIIFIALWLIILALVLSFARCGSVKELDNSKSIIEKEKSEAGVEKSRKENILNELLLNTDDFILPDRRSLDATNDIADILSAKKQPLTDKAFINKEYKKMVDSDIEESLKFNFEKRKTEK